MALYFFNTINQDWNTLGNWYEDDQQAVPASALPTSSDDVYVVQTCASNSGSSAVAHDVEVSGGIVFDITITCNTFRAYPNSTLDTQSSIYCNQATIEGVLYGNMSCNDITVQGSGSIETAATVTCDTILFQSYAYTGGTITAEILITFIDSSYGYGHDEGNVRIEGNSNYSGLLIGNLTAYGIGSVGYEGTYLASSVSGNAIFEETSMAYPSASLGYNYLLETYSSGVTTTMRGEAVCAAGSQFHSSGYWQAAGNPCGPNSPVIVESPLACVISGMGTSTITFTSVNVAEGSIRAAMTWNYYNYYYSPQDAFSSVIINYETGINGSSILGIL